MFAFSFQFRSKPLLGWKEGYCSQTRALLHPRFYNNTVDKEREGGEDICITVLYCTLDAHVGFLISRRYIVGRQIAGHYNIIISFLTLGRSHEESLGRINFRPRFLGLSSRLTRTRKQRVFVDGNPGRAVRRGSNYNIILDGKSCSCHHLRRSTPVMSAPPPHPILHYYFAPGSFCALVFSCSFSISLSTQPIVISVWAPRCKQSYLFAGFRIIQCMHMNTTCAYKVNHAQLAVEEN